jgi:beta-alanine degradation protein BauB
LAERQLSPDVGTRVLFEDDEAKVWLLELAPGQATPWHAHSCDYVFVITKPGVARCEYVDGSIEEQVDDPRGSAQYRPRDLPHRLVNTGNEIYQNIIVELKVTKS